MDIKLFVTDIDGVWTDGSMYYLENGDEIKRFNTNDSLGVLMLQKLKIPLAIITGENTEMVKRRAKKLKIDLCFSGIVNKVKVATELANQFNIDFKNIAFIGDGLNDLALLKKVGLSATPNQALNFIKNEVDFICTKKGGDGAFTEFVIHYLKKTNQFNLVLNEVISSYTN